jgi:hypothetical protein
MADQFKYRGYVIYLVAEADVWGSPKGEKGWRASAVPLSPDLPILPKASSVFSLHERRPWLIAKNLSMGC